MSDIKPFGDRVIFEVAKREDKAGGIIVPDSVKEDTEQGIVVAAGPESTLQGGDRVLFSRHTVEAFKLDGKLLLITHERELIAKL